MIAEEHKTALRYIIIMLLVLLAVTFFWAYMSTRHSVTLQDIVRTDSGVSIEVRKAAILELAERGADRVSDAEKDEIMLSISGNKVNAFNFTGEELDKIFNVINN